MASFWDGLAGAAQGASRGLQTLIVMREAEAERKRLEEEKLADRNFIRTENETSRAASAREAQRGRIQSGQQFERTLSFNEDKEFGANLGRMNVGSPDPGALRQLLSPSQLPMQDVGTVDTGQPGLQLPIGPMMQEANAGVQERASALRPEFMSAFGEAAKQGQQSQRDVPIEGFDAAYISQKFNPNTGGAPGSAAAVNAATRATALRQKAGESTYEFGLAALKAHPALQSLKNMFANPATQAQAIQTAIELAKAGMASRWQMMQQMDPSLADIDFDPSWINGVMPSLVNELSGGKGPPGPAAPSDQPVSDVDRYRSLLQGSTNH